MCHHYVEDELALAKELRDADADEERVEDEPQEEDEPAEPAMPEPAADD